LYKDAHMLIVQKFGGTSVGSIERIKSVARILIESQRAGHRVVGVVSAMSGETNRLVDLATQINPQPWSREYDMLLASGEQVSAALVSLAINAMGGKARPLLGYQIGILTDQVYSKARIQAIDTTVLEKELAQGVIPIVAGFQGVDCENNITTLGRGGSDTSAVALAAALKADRCDIFTDVDGVYTTDPRICPRARKIDKITYEEMMELASLGAKVLQIRSVELGAKYNVPIMVCSSFDPSVPGTLVTKEDRSMENVVVSGVAADANDAKVSVMNLPDRPGLAYDIFGALAEAAIVVDVIVQNSSAEGRCALSFTVPRNELTRAVDLVKRLFATKHPEMEIATVTDLAKVSIVGQGMRHHPGVAAKMFKVLADAGIDIKLITTSEIKISVLVHQDRMKDAVQRLHAAFDLDAVN
jgi:aspartate kinase